MNQQVNRLERIENLILGLWIGAMVGIGYIAAPVLFSTLDDRALAGQLAGEMFRVVGYAGLFAGVILLLGLLFKEAGSVMGQWRFWVLSTMIAIVCASLFYIQPSMAELKALGLTDGTEEKKRFGMLHGVSSVLYLVNTVLGVSLILSGMRPQGRRVKTLAEINQL